MEKMRLPRSEYCTPPKGISDEVLFDWIAERFRLLIEPGQVMELRILEYREGRGRPHTRSGFYDFDHVKEMIVAAHSYMKSAKGVYFTLNPLTPVLLNRRKNRVDYATEGTLAKDGDVVNRRWMLIDVDPVRDPYVSSTDEEKLLAYDKILAVREHLRGLSWPEPIMADSGNGCHLLYRIDQPSRDGGTIERILRSLAEKFDDEHAKIDRKVFNPSRICKFPWTMTRKGDSTIERPHRWSRLLEVPNR